MKDGNLLHRFNKNLLFYLLLAAVLVAIGFTLFGHREIKTAAPAEKQGTAKDNVDVGKSDQAQVAPVRAIGADDHLWGPADAPVKMIIYDDFECPFCAKFYQTTEQAKKEFGDKVVVALRHYPLTSIHVYSMQAAIASECAAEQGKFWEMYNKLFADNLAGNLNETQFKADAKMLGLDTVKFDQCLFQEKYKDKITGEMLEAKSFNVNGTPTSFINGEIVPGAYPFEDFTGPDGVKTEGIKSIINRHLK